MYICNNNNINKILIIFNNHYTQYITLSFSLADNRKVRKNRLSNCHNCHSLFSLSIFFLCPPTLVKYAASLLLIETIATILGRKNSLVWE